MQDFGSFQPYHPVMPVAYKPRPNGWLPIPVGVGKMFYVQGGPFEALPDDATYFSLCLEARASNVAQADVIIDVPDFSVPDSHDMEAALMAMVDALYDDFDGYIGCRGGIGRTGLAMACLVKAFGIKESVAYVRRHYLAHAVETPDQHDFIEKFDVSRLKSRIRYNRLRSIFK